MKAEEIPVYVTQPALPPLEEFVKDLEKIWEDLTDNSIGFKSLSALYLTFSFKTGGMG